MRERGRSGWGHGIGAVLAGLVLMGLALPGAQRGARVSAGPVGSGPPAPDSVLTMEMLLEKTIFQVDVLTLTVELRGEAAERIRRLARARDPSGSVADSVARIAAHATRARARLSFERDVSLDRFLDEVRRSSRAAREAGFISPGMYDFIDRSLPEWYAFLEDRGVREGDEMSYSIRGDTLGIRYRAADGTLLLDRSDVGAERRRSVLGGYFAPGSDFREGLIRSAFRREEPGP